MPIPRHPARPSFTFEIKRANRRSPEVVTLSRTSSTSLSSDSLALAGQVFGKVSGRPADAGARSGRIEGPAPARLTHLFDATPGVEQTHRAGFLQPPVATPRRVLPDLISAPVDPVEERVRQEVEERATRRRGPRVKHPKSEVTSQITTSGDTSLLAPDAAEAILPDLTPASGLGSAPLVQVPNSCGSGAVSPNPINAALLRRVKRAKRSGQPLPRLPAGQRWKRRLPQACW
jgi:hypothetical protein